MRTAYKHCVKFAPPQPEACGQHQVHGTAPRRGCLTALGVLSLILASATAQSTTALPEETVTGHRDAATGTEEPTTEGSSASTPTAAAVTATDSLFTSPDDADGQTTAEEECGIAANPTAFQSKLGNFSHWALSTDAAPCAGVARKIMKKGGNLVDVAVATMICMGVVLPHAMGIGGGFVATIYLRCPRQAMTLVARELAPGAASRDMFVGNETLARRGGLSVAVPGELRGYYALLRELHGTLNWREHFRQAIRVARDGFPVGPQLAAVLQEHKHDLSESLRKVFWNEATNDTYAEGELLVQPDLADTLWAIANKGPDYFYKGDFAEQMVKEIRENGGVMTMSDLKRYAVSWEAPVQTTFQDGLTLHSVPAPASGAVLAHILGVMDAFRASPDDLLPDDALTLHRFTEACKFAYAKRALLGDRRFVHVEELQYNLTSHEFAMAVRNMINDSCTFDDPAHYGFLNESLPQDEGTAHATFWSDIGDVIAITSTINSHLGSHVRTSSGVILNNQMDDFSTPGMSNSYDISPSQPNYIEPRKRPVSSMAPSVVVDSNGDAVLALGGAGGSKITSSVALVAMRTLWQGDNIKEAIDFPRIHHQLIPNEVVVEPDLSEDYVSELESKGHVVTTTQKKSSSVNGIRRDGDRLYASYDYRRAGGVDGE
ncbi:hypothetical protein V5799_021302 [Amblyomma americanum]|uniref:Gamma-glutamyltransferase n=1 Tax=Amblyomma americanum TaxID=6943 RepID=A0AAQ4FNV6_AMBAM